MLLLSAPCFAAGSVFHVSLTNVTNPANLQTVLNAKNAILKAVSSLTVSALVSCGF